MAAGLGGFPGHAEVFGAVERALEQASRGALAAAQACDASRDQVATRRGDRDGAHVCAQTGESTVDHAVELPPVSAAGGDEVERDLWHAGVRLDRVRRVCGTVGELIRRRAEVVGGIVEPLLCDRHACEHDHRADTVDPHLDAVGQFERMCRACGCLVEPVDADRALGPDQFCPEQRSGGATVSCTVRDLVSRCRRVVIRPTW
jgi:hypothetical protein